MPDIGPPRLNSRGGCNECNTQLAECKDKVERCAEVYLNDKEKLSNCMLNHMGKLQGKPGGCNECNIQIAGCNVNVAKICVEYSKNDSKEAANCLLYNLGVVEEEPFWKQ